MSEKLPRLTAAEIIKVLEKFGFVLARQSGSHKIYKNASGRRATVPFHGSRILHPKVLKSILSEARGFMSFTTIIYDPSKIVTSNEYRVLVNIHPVLHDACKPLEGDWYYCYFSD